MFNMFAGHSSKVTKTEDVLEWIKWIFNIAKGFLDPLYIGHLKLDLDEEAVKWVFKIFFYINQIQYLITGSQTYFSNQVVWL